MDGMRPDAIKPPHTSPSPSRHGVGASDPVHAAYRSGEASDAPAPRDVALLGQGHGTTAAVPTNESLPPAQVSSGFAERADSLPRDPDPRSSGNAPACLTILEEPSPTPVTRPGPSLLSVTGETPAVPDSAGSVDADAAFLKKFGSRNRAGLGVLLTPPRGHLSPEIRRAQEYLETLVTDLAGPSLRGCRMRVNLYSGDSLNAFMERLDGTRHDDPNREPARRLFDAEDGRRPVYELGITLGALRQLGSEEELKFVLGHELGHFKERHVEEGSTLDRQAYEVVADSLAFDAMVASGASPQGGLRLLERLFEGKASDDVQSALDGLRAGLESHHQEGVRLALAQAKVRQLQESHPELPETSEQTPLPDFIQVAAAPRGDDPAGRASAVSKMADLAETCMRAAQGGKHEEHEVPRLRPDDVSQALLAGLDRIDRSNATGTEKLDAALTYFGLLRGGTSGTLELQAGARWALTNAFARYMREGGTPEAFLDHAKRNVTSRVPARWEALLEPDLIQSLEPLATRHPEVVALYRDLPATVARVRGKQEWGDLGETTRLVGRLRELEGLPGASEGSPPSLLRTQLRDSTVSTLEACLNARPSTLETAGPALMLLSEGTGSSPLNRAVDGVIGRHLDRVTAVRAGELETLLREAVTPEGQKSWKTQEAVFRLSSLGRLLPHRPLQSDEEQRVRPALLSFLASSANQFGHEVPPLDLSTKPELLRTLTSLATAPERTDQERKDVTAFIFSNLPSTTLPRRGAASEALNDLGRQVTPSLDRSELLRLMRETPEPAPSRGSATQEHWFHRLATPLSLLARDPEASRRLASELRFDDIRQMTGELSRRIDGVLGSVTGKSGYGVRVPLKLGGEAPRVLLDGLVASQNQAPSAETWHEAVTDLLTLSPQCLNGRPEQRRALEGHLLSHLDLLQGNALEEWLRKPHVTEILSSTELARQLSRLALPDEGQAGREGRHADPWTLRNQVSHISGSFQMQEKHPVAWSRFREQLAERAQMQPRELGIVFDEVSPTGLTTRASGLSGEIRGLSALVGATRTRPPSEQLDMVDYLMGRREMPPEFVSELDHDLQGKSQGGVNVLLTDLLEDARSRLVGAEPSLRTLVATSLLAGPNSLLASQEGRDVLLDRILSGVSPERKGLARHLAGALLESQGSSQALAVGFLQAQSETSGTPLSEGATLAQLFRAYGVPGTKFMQYLAFTGDFAEFRKDFESSQDSADPPTHLESLELIRHYFGDADWRSEWEVLGLKGSGSVNVAVEYHDRYAGENRIVTMSRENVENRANVDFRGIERFLERLTAQPDDRDKYGYLLGLCGVIKKSVSLEFDRQAAFDMQKSVQPLYHRNVNGWDVRTVDALEYKKGAILMEKAPGVSARRMLEEDPFTYQSAMRALAQVETDVLLGMDERGRPWPAALPANPDFHNGQVLIDPENRRVTLLDFGQAVQISNQERDYGIDLLGVLSGQAFSAAESAAILSKRGGVVVSEADLAGIIDRKEPMDRFVRTLAMMTEKGAEVPLPVVHWVLGVHRQRVLGEQIGQSIEPTLKNLLVTRRLGGNLALHNIGRVAKRAFWEAVEHVGEGTRFLHGTP